MRRGRSKTTAKALSTTTDPPEKRRITDGLTKLKS
jgi:hypothetical protein